MKQSGCLKCNERVVGCHSNCLRYEQFKDELNTIKENREQARKQYSKFKRRKKSL